MFFKRLFKCKHRVATFGSQPVYGSLRFVARDGMNTEHAAVWVRCGKCGEEFNAAMVHLPARTCVS